MGTDPSAPPPTLPPAMAQPPPPQTTLPAVAFPTVSEQRLDNGVAVWVASRPGSPLTTVTLAVNAGRDHNATEARLAARAAVAGGAGQFSASQLTQRLAAQGTALTVESSADTVAWSLTLPPEHLDFAVEALSAVARQPRWVYAEFARVRDQQMTRIRELARHDDTWAALRLLHRELFPSHPYGEYDSTATELGNVGLADCQRWYRAHVRPDNTSLVVVGPQAPAAVAPLAEKHLAAWTATQEPLAPVPPLPSSPPKPGVHVIDRGQSERVQILVGWRIPGAGTEEHALGIAALRLLCGPQGRFVPRGTERVSDCSTRAYSGEVGLALVSVTTSLPTATSTAKRLMSAIRHLEEEPVSAEIWESNVRDLLGRAPRRWESSHGLAAVLTRLTILDVPQDWPTEETRHWRESDASRARSFAQRYFGEGRSVVVVSADATNVARKLTALGSVAVHDPTDLRTTKTVHRENR